MKRLLAVFLLTFALAPAAFTQEANQKEAALKLQPGAYYWTGSSWNLMDQITAYGGSASHVARMIVPGLVPQFALDFRDARAPVQVSDATPLFCFKFAVVPPGTPYAPYSPSGREIVVVRSGVPYMPSGRDIAITRLDQKKDHRELEVSSGNTMFTMKAGTDDKRLVDIEVTRLSADTFLVSPRVPLPQGEYLLNTLPYERSGFDFGFHPATGSNSSH
ncbi:MAG TPA: hypothetical protein VKB26_01010 [Candidatus Acidoferrales bacterium]|nr:hypothetical protein [Candidatus Acidoferrales bacterium]